MVATNYLLGFSTRRMETLVETLVETLGITQLARSQALLRAKELDELVDAESRARALLFSSRVVGSFPCGR